MKEKVEETIEELEDLKERVLQQKELDYGPKVRSYFDNVVL